MRIKELKKIYSGRQWQRQWEIFHLAHNWEHIAGPAVGGASYPAFVRVDVLWVYVENAAWMQQLQFIKMDVLARVQSALPDTRITDVRFVVHPLATKKQPQPTPRKGKPIDKVQEKRFVDMVSHVGNEECQQALHRLWQAYAENGEEEDASNK